MKEAVTGMEPVASPIFGFEVRYVVTGRKRTDCFLSRERIGAAIQTHYIQETAEVRVFVSAYGDECNNSQNGKMSWVRKTSHGRLRYTMMKLSVTGPTPPKNEHCWRAIVIAVENWKSTVEGATLEAQFSEDAESLLFSMSAPGKAAETASVDTTWIAYADQAEHLALHTLMALREVERAMIEQNTCTA